MFSIHNSIIRMLRRFLKWDQSFLCWFFCALSLRRLYQTQTTAANKYVKYKFIACLRFVPYIFFVFFLWVLFELMEQPNNVAYGAKILSAMCKKGRKARGRERTSKTRTTITICSSPEWVSTRAGKYNRSNPRARRAFSGKQIARRSTWFNRNKSILRKWGRKDDWILSSQPASAREHRNIFAISINRVRIASNRCSSAHLFRNSSQIFLISTVFFVILYISICFSFASVRNSPHFSVIRMKAGTATQQTDLALDGNVVNLKWCFPDNTLLYVTRMRIRGKMNGWEPISQTMLLYIVVVAISIVNWIENLNKMT